jgi:hypothetical protein
MVFPLCRSENKDKKASLGTDYRNNYALILVFLG